MKTYEEMVQEYTGCRSPEPGHFSPAGKSYRTDNQYYRGCYWFYEAPYFIVDIHDFFIKKSHVESVPDMTPFFFLISDYTLCGSGEWLEPYQPIEPSSIFTMNTVHPPKRYVLHGNSRYYVVGMKFKEAMVEEWLSSRTGYRKEQIYALFAETQQIITQQIAKISEDILHCRMDGLAAELFFEAKAREWLSITVHAAFEKQRQRSALPPRDRCSVETAARYLEDHYAMEVPQEFLERITAMSGTKLKSAFRQRYHMSITEFTQRKRMNIAENLLLTTELDTCDIARCVGYRSPSRFSVLFKRYKGLCPRELRKQRIPQG